MKGASDIIDLRLSDVIPDGDPIVFPAATAIGTPIAPPVATPVAELYAEPAMLDLTDDVADEPRTFPWERVFAGLLILVAIGWVGFYGWFVAPPLSAGFFALAQTIALATIPLILLGVLWLIAHRSSAVAARRFQATAQAMRVEAEHLENVVAAMSRTIDANRAALGSQVTTMMAAASGMAEQIADAERQAASLDAAARTAEEKLQVVLASLPRAHTDTEALIARIEATGLTASQHAAALDSQIVALGERGREADALTSGAAERLAANIARMEATSETAAARLESVTAGMSSTVDGLLDRTASAVDEARKGITAQGDAMQAMVATNQATLDRTATDSAAALAERITAIETVVNQVAATIAEGEARIATMTQTIADSNDAAQRFAGEAAPQLLESLMRIRDTANAAADHAREAIAKIVPDATGSIEEAGRQALEESLSAIAEAQEIAAASAVQASDQLNQQMLALADASNEIDARLADTHDADGFARRVTQLTETLQSAAIDLSGIYAKDVLDSSWAAYLKGERGTFSRRAVKLLDTGDIRAVTTAYEGDPTAREQINRYIHDFEAMLRAVLAQRDSAPMGVVLLSSDMGKLYVALAQAIERLR
ncbi:MAG: hypothetical protein J0I47_03085 [Sphingomonas sp.]|uniref:hypothetical protein n=1 Tax=Sphingomonas sp. TaxID=28214 RepID=UPI001AC35AE1|nr:hypothetical protein [Sphingomonas sp.]MBN8807211.1 hypothetical protein [Sphingomonas sp.]